jgi:hypothetical protein
MSDHVQVTRERQHLGPGRAFWVLAGVAALGAISGLAVVIATQSGPEQRARLWLEVAKGLIQILVIGVLGSALKLLADSYQSRLDQRRTEEADARLRSEEVAEARVAFWSQQRRTLVETAAVLRKASVLIAANRSVKTWSEQMVAVMNADGQLFATYHEIAASEATEASPLPDIKQALRAIDDITDYTRTLTKDFVDNKKRLSELQNAAEDKALEPSERQRKQDDVWAALLQLDSVADLVRERRIDGAPSWRSFEQAYSDGLSMFVTAALNPSSRANRGSASTAGTAPASTTGSPAVA